MPPGKPGGTEIGYSFSFVASTPLIPENFGCVERINATLNDRT